MPPPDLNKSPDIFSSFSKIYTVIPHNKRYIFTDTDEAISTNGTVFIGKKRGLPVCPFQI